MSIATVTTIAALAVLPLVRPAADAAAGSSISVPAGGDLQAAIDRARPGDVILLEPGATYVGNFTLPARDGSQYITIRSAAPSLRFRTDDARVGPGHARFMPTLRSPNGAAALATKPGAHHWRLQWLAFQANQGGAGDVITLGDGSEEQRDLATVPHDLVLDGLIIRGDPAEGQKRAIALNSGATVIRNCDIRDIKAAGQDSQAIGGWNGPGPFVIENNYLEAAGENILFGGADPAIRDLVPSDITIRRNHLTKPLAWREDGSPWTVKNLLELKNARRVLIEYNLIEHNWQSAQPGFAILFTPMNQDGNAPWTVVSDVTFRYNLVRHVAAGINILGYDYQATSEQTRRIEILHNLFFDVNASRWGGDGHFLQIGDEPADIEIDHNTVIQSGSVLLLYGKKSGNPRPVANLQLTNNLALHNEYGIFGEDVGVGRAAIAAFMSREDIRRNVLGGADASNYPSDNFFPSVQEFLAEFVDSAQDDYRLRPTSRFRSAATDSTMIGADVEAILKGIPSTPPASGRAVPRR